MSDSQRGLAPWPVVGGIILFGVIDFGLYMALAEQENGWIVVAAAVVILAGFLLAFGHRSFAFGVLAGYVIMTIVSGGACTITFADPLNEGGGAFVALLLYPAVVVVGIIVAAVAGRDK